MLAFRKAGSDSCLEGADEGYCSAGMKRLGVRYPPGEANFGVKGVKEALVERWKEALRDGVKGLARGGVCLSEVIVAGSGRMTYGIASGDQDLQA